MKLFSDETPSSEGAASDMLLNGLEAFLGFDDTDCQEAEEPKQTSQCARSSSSSKEPEYEAIREAAELRVPSPTSSTSSTSSSPTTMQQLGSSNAPLHMAGAPPQDNGNLLIAPPNESNQAFVNVFMVIDPNSMTCVVPKQVISYKNKDNVISTCTFGPKVVSSSQLIGTGKETKSTDSVPVPAPTPIVEPKRRVSPLVPPSVGAPLASELSNRDAKETSMGPPPSMPPPSAPTSNNENEPLPPLRALSAYNFFFRDERERILSGVKPDWSEDKKIKLLHEHWYQDRNKKRRHRKTHGKIDFTTLSKLISTRWKELPEEHKDFYRQIAARDFARFKKESKPIELSMPPPPLPPGAFATHAAVVG